MVEPITEGPAANPVPPGKEPRHRNVPRKSTVPQPATKMVPLTSGLGRTSQQSARYLEIAGMCRSRGKID